MPDKLVLLAVNDESFAAELTNALSKGYRLIGLKEWSEVKASPVFFVMSTRPKKWAEFVALQIEVGEKVAVVFRRPNPAGEKVALELGAVILRATDNAEVIRNALKSGGLIPS